MRRPCVAAVLIAASIPSAIACDCLPAAGYTDKDVANVLAKADAVVHAKVVSLRTSREARIMIYESFKGQPSMLVAQAADQGGCGTTFQAGEEAIYVVYEGKVSLCGKLAARSELVKRLRAHRR